MTSFIDLQIDKHVAVVTINTPRTRNALSSDEQYGAIEDVCKRLSGDRSIRAAVWTEAGKAFCAGGDIKAMLARTRDTRQLKALDDRYHYKEGIHRIPASLYYLEVPVIAAVNGPAIGAGLDLACMCDIRIAARLAVRRELREARHHPRRWRRVPVAAPWSAPRRRPS